MFLFCCYFVSKLYMKICNQIAILVYFFIYNVCFIIYFNRIYCPIFLDFYFNLNSREVLGLSFCIFGNVT